MQCVLSLCNCRTVDEKKEDDEEAEKKPMKKITAEDIELYEKELEVIKVTLDMPFA